MASKPTLIFVPGAWHIASLWDKVTSLLSAHHKCITITLPSTLGSASTTLLDDINAVRNAIIAETSLGLDVVLVLHSYGGAVGQCAVKGLTRPAEPPHSSEKKNYVIGLAMMASGFGQTGVGFLEALGGKPPPFWELSDDGFCTLLGSITELFYHDLPAEEAEEWLGKLTRQASLPLTAGGEWSYAGWKDLPVWYLLTVEDKAGPPAAQRMMIEMVRESGKEIVVREVESSHSPMLSKPVETAKFVEDATEAFVGESQ